LVERGRTAYQKTSATYFRSGLFILLLGSVFLVLGVFGVSSGTGGEWGYFLLVVGLLFAGMGVSHFISARRMSQK
jgi:membrane-bound ClpP family serine protease